MVQLKEGRGNITRSQTGNGKSFFHSGSYFLEDVVRLVDGAVKARVVMAEVFLNFSIHLERCFFFSLSEFLLLHS